MKTLDAVDLDIQMVDLKRQYQAIKPEIDSAIQEVIDQTAFINGPQVRQFAASLADYVNVSHVIPCANGTDALQLAFMALDLQAGHEVIVPAFTYVATAEVLALLGLIPIMVDVDPQTFNIDPKAFENAITDKTKAVVPVHLFGLHAPMKEILAIAKKYNLYVVEDAAQSIGGLYHLEGKWCASGTIGDVGTTSFFPSKNLGCYGDGGAMFTNNDRLAQTLQMLANHGQAKKYVHTVIGCNSRLDTMQAAILNVKLKYLDTYIAKRQSVADYYDTAFSTIASISIPHRMENSNHVFHQYTIKVADGKRDELKAFLQEKGIPSMVYYPIPLHEQEAFRKFYKGQPLPNATQLCNEVLSLPIHTEMTEEQLSYIVQQVNSFFA